MEMKMKSKLILVVMVASLLLVCGISATQPMDRHEAKNVIRLLEVFGLEAKSTADEVHSLITRLARKSPLEVFEEWPLGCTRGCLSLIFSCDPFIRRSVEEETKDVAETLEHIRHLKEVCEPNWDQCRWPEERPMDYFSRLTLRKKFSSALGGYLQHRERQLKQFCMANVHVALKPVVQSEDSQGLLLALIGDEKLDSRPSYANILRMLRTFRATRGNQFKHIDIFASLKINSRVFSDYLSHWADGTDTQFKPTDTQLEKYYFAHLLWSRISDPKMVESVDEYMRQIQGADLRRLVSYITQSYGVNVKMSDERLSAELAGDLDRTFAGWDKLLLQVCNPADAELKSAMILMWSARESLEQQVSASYSAPVVMTCRVHSKWLE